MRLKYRNNTAAFMWVFMVIWNLLGPGLLVYFAIRDGIPDDSEHADIVWLAMVILFCAGGLFGSVYAARQCCVSVNIAEDKTVSVVWRYPFKVVRKSFAAGNVQPAQIVETKDSEGDPYYTCQFSAAYTDYKKGAPTDTINLKESHSREVCEQNCRDFNFAVFE